MNIIKSYKGQKTDVDAVLYDNGVLFIKGTWGWKDVRQDLKTVLWIKHWIVAHLGALQQASELLRIVDWSKVSKIEGHSLGGAVALICALRKKIPVEVFGAFRPFPIWMKLIFLFMKLPEATCYIYGADAVPRLFWFRCYYGKVVRIKGDGFHPISDHNRYEQLEQFKS